MTRDYDVIVIGAGPGGLSAAAAARAQGAVRVAVLERDDRSGGILNQCVHDGFGLVRYGAQLSGPEYGEMEAAKAEAAGAEILTGYMVTGIRRLTDPCDPAGFAIGRGTNPCSPAGFAVTAISRNGRHVLRTGAVVLATGCRERTRGMLSIPGTRPAGIFTAGVAQNLINCRNVMVGRRVVILGSGDIGLIMARRLTLEGARVLCVAEALPRPSGLARNVRQCLYDYDIPLYLSTTVSNIFGKDRLEGVELSPVDGQGAIGGISNGAGGISGGNSGISCATRRIPCDTLILSVGLIPENEVAKTAGIVPDPKKGGVRTDPFLQTGVPGIFACGNSREVMDLADFVSEQGETAGRNAAVFAAFTASPAARTAASPDACRTGKTETFSTERYERWEKTPHKAARKGLPEENSVLCTLCPRGCQIRIRPVADSGDTDQDKALRKNDDHSQWSVSGNGCPRGEAFAIQEMTDPQRILTTTIRLRKGLQINEETHCPAGGCETEQAGKQSSAAASPRDILLPVRSDRPVALREMKRLVRQLQDIVIALTPCGPASESAASGPSETSEPFGLPGSSGPSDPSETSISGNDPQIIIRKQVRRGDILLRNLGENQANIIAEQSV